MRPGIAVRTAAAVAAVVVLVSGCSSVAAGGAGRAPAHAATSQSATSPSTISRSAAARDGASRTLTTKHAARKGPCAHNRTRQLVRVSLHRQHLWMCRYRHLNYSTPITSGMTSRYTRTPTGNYRIQARDRNTTLTLYTGQQFQVKYWIPFDAPLYGFHDSSWQKFPYGSPKYHKHGSHGCVHMPLKAIAHLYHWAHIGAKVKIRR